MRKSLNALDRAILTIKDGRVREEVWSRKMGEGETFYECFKYILGMK